MNTSAHHNSMIQTLHFGLNKIPKNLEHSQLGISQYQFILQIKIPLAVLRTTSKLN